MSKIPFNDLSLLDQSIRNQLEEAFKDVLNQGYYIGGPEITRFENAFKEYIGTSHCIGAGNGSDAMELILRGLDINPGDEIILPSNGHFSSYEAIARVGARAVFADIDEFLQINPESVREKINSKTRAVIVVHLHGNLADMIAMQKLTKAHGLYLVEDCAQAAGAVHLYTKAGSLGDAAAFSFYPTKNLGAYGDAGAITTNREELAKICRLLANHGEVSKNKHILTGQNSRLDVLQARLLMVKLPHLDRWNEERQQMADNYNELLKDTPIQLPVARPDCKPAWHLYVIRTNQREKIMHALAAHQIGYSIHYPEIIPATTALRPLGYKPGTYPKAYRSSQEMLSLPFFIGLTIEQQEQIATVIKGCFS